MASASTASRPAAGPTGQRRSGAGVVVLGGTSEIAQAIVRELSAEGPRAVALVGRDEHALEAAAERLRAGGAGDVMVLAGMDALQSEAHRGLIERASEMVGGTDTIILAVGVLGERGGLPADTAGALRALAVNTVGAGSLLLESAGVLRERGGGSLVVLSSMAAERPRRTNAVYCAGKAALDGLGQALADDLRDAGVRVMVVRPGFVRTRMTEGLPVPPLACSAEEVARATVRGMRRGAQTIWAPPRMRWVGLVLRLIPRPIFRRLSL
ncbi:MAG: SDR family NAD(P)-dependent oxidoreductase [Acidobacteriota bacterium]|nr:SDR family NAD(P)-dependent oxidoreductase [Acidobacteriota bacterium]